MLSRLSSTIFLLNDLQTAWDEVVYNALCLCRFLCLIVCLVFWGLECWIFRFAFLDYIDSTGEHYSLIIVMNVRNLRNENLNRNLLRNWSLFFFIFFQVCRNSLNKRLRGSVWRNFQYLRKQQERAASLKATAKEDFELCEYCRVRR